MDVLSRVELEKFEDWTLAHLRRFFPAQSAALGERGARELIQYGIRRAAHYGFNAKRDVCKYIDLMTIFGRDFDTDKRHHWAAAILARPTEPPLKMQSLFNIAQMRLKRR